MPVNLFAAPRCRLATLLLVSICAGCNSIPEQHPDNRYQRPVDSSRSTPAVEVTPVKQLQSQALAAINEDQYPLAIDFLQRAIKIQPRNAWSWHYLADIYRRRGERERCLAMIDRSQSYAVNDNRLDEANAALRAQCS
jgi:tetratricopeptide (TPR) repeat protein